MSTEDRARRSPPKRSEVLFIAFAMTIARNDTTRRSEPLKPCDVSPARGGQAEQPSARAAAGRVAYHLRRRTATSPRN
jgi:hypothetical protein